LGDKDRIGIENKTETQKEKEGSIVPTFFFQSEYD